jgi:hypothetical protein
MSAATEIEGWRVPGYMRTWAYKKAVSDGVSHEDALIHATKCNTESSLGDEYASLYHRARTCGASHAQAAQHADACISARAAASEYAETDWSPEKIAPEIPRDEILARLQRIESLLLSR